MSLRERLSSHHPSLKNTRSDGPSFSENYLSYEAALLVPDRCQHTYRIIYFHDPPQQKAATTRRPGDRGPGDGGL